MQLNTTQTGWDNYTQNDTTDIMATAISNAVSLPLGILYFDNIDLVFFDRTVGTLDLTIGQMVDNVNKFMQQNAAYVNSIIQLRS